MAHTASLNFTFDDEPTASAIHQALAPEAQEGPEGTHTVLRRDDATIEAHIEADDLSGLRAAIHSVVRLLDAAQRTLA